jgi:hypothetical protein
VSEAFGLAATSIALPDSQVRHGIPPQATSNGVKIPSLGQSSGIARFKRSSHRPGGPAHAVGGSAGSRHSEAHLEPTRASRRSRPGSPVRATESAISGALSSGSVISRTRAQRPPLPLFTVERNSPTPSASSGCPSRTAAASCRRQRRCAGSSAAWPARPSYGRLAFSPRRTPHAPAQCWPTHPGPEFEPPHMLGDRGGLPKTGCDAASV